MRDARRLSPLDGAVIGVVAAALVLLVVLALVDRSRNEQPGTATSSTTSTATTAARFDRVTPTFAPTGSSDTTTATDVATTQPAITTTTTTSTAPSGDALAGLVVAPENLDAGYDRGLFQHWIDADGNGCDTRCEVLKAERRTDLAGLPSGWLSIYDGYTTDDPSELDVDHVVALGEAWRSGANTWDAGRRRAFANDLDEPDALIAVTASTNRSKSDRDPANWQPPARASWCQFGLAWIRVKIKWGLTADASEVRALQNMTVGCR